MPLFSDEITLIGTEIGYDDIGNPTEVESEVTVLGSKRSTTRAEFYGAANNGITPTLVFTIHSFEYSKESKARYEGVVYKIIRTYEANVDELELTLEKVN